MEKQYYFISGLPRSGSTLLSALLKQNPNFYASISNNLLGHMLNALSVPGEKVDGITFDDKRKNMIHGMFDGYYKNADENIIFNTNRGWTNYLHILKYLHPNTKVIICVRDIISVVNSIETAHRKNLLDGSATTGPVGSTIYERTKNFMDENGFVNGPYNGIKSALYSNETDMLMFVEYDDLCKNPEGTLKRIYNFIDQPFYENHSFIDIQTENDWQEFDKKIGIELHTLHKEIFYKERKCILPIDIQRRLKDLEIWREKHPKIYT